MLRIGHVLLEIFFFFFFSLQIKYFQSVMVHSFEKHQLELSLASR